MAKRFRFSWTLVLLSLIVVAVVAYVKSNVEENFQNAAQQVVVTKEINNATLNSHNQTSVTATEIPQGKTLKNIRVFASRNNAWVPVESSALSRAGFKLKITKPAATITVFVGNAAANANGNTCLPGLTTTGVQCSGARYNRRINLNAASPNPVLASDLQGATGMQVESYAMVQKGAIQNDTTRVNNRSNFKIEYIFE
jgi:hypothetical protein